MLSETDGLRTRPVSDQKKFGLGLASYGLGLAHLVLFLSCRSKCCVVKHGLVTLVVIMILKDSNFSVLFIVLC